MKRILFLSALAMMMVACGQQDNNNKGQLKPEQPQEKQETVLQDTTKTPKAPVQNNASQPVSTNGPVLKVEEGKPLDLSQLLGSPMTTEQKLIAQIDSIRFKAERGDADYQYAYGFCYERGWGVDQDNSQALAWFKKSAAQDFGPSYNALGNFYRSGTAVKKDEIQAFQYYQKGAELEDVQSMLNLGNCYYYGVGTTKEVTTAANWWKKAADAGNAYAMAQMGDCYYSGVGVEKDLDKAVEYFTQAADKNIPNAQYRLGVFYYAGHGVPKNLPYSERLLRKASAAGMTEAQDFLDKNF